jgi:hypothetical protein
MQRQQIAWYLWLIGCVLVVLSWIDVVSYKVGWCGFFIGLVGSVISWGLAPPKGTAAEQPAEEDDLDSLKEI